MARKSNVDLVDIEFPKELGYLSPEAKQYIFNITLKLQERTEQLNIAKSELSTVDELRSSQRDLMDMTEKVIRLEGERSQVQAKLDAAVKKVNELGQVINRLEKGKINPHVGKDNWYCMSCGKMISSPASAGKIKVCPAPCFGQIVPLADLDPREIYTQLQKQKNDLAFAQTEARVAKQKVNELEQAVKDRNDLVAELKKQVDHHDALAGALAMMTQGKSESLSKSERVSRSIKV